MVQVYWKRCRTLVFISLVFLLVLFATHRILHKSNVKGLLRRIQGQARNRPIGQIAENVSLGWFAISGLLSALAKNFQNTENQTVLRKCNVKVCCVAVSPRLAWVFILVCYAVLQRNQFYSVNNNLLNVLKISLILCSFSCMLSKIKQSTWFKLKSSILLCKTFQDVLSYLHFHFWEAEAWPALHQFLQQHNY